MALPDGRTLVVRPVRPADVDGLAALYAGLGAEDRYRRFFSVYHPPRAFFERLAGVAAEGGFGLVALVTAPGASPDAGGDDRVAEPAADLVGEASFVLLPNGNGELGVVVAPRWRGWLGPHLLDALLSAAAARGVPNLEADILVSNGPMLALARSRDCTIRDRPDPAVVRVVIATGPRHAGSPPCRGRSALPEPTAAAEAGTDQ